jgi:DNA topoisomerase-1
VGTAALTASGRTITFPGFLRAYVQGTDEGDSSDDSRPQVACPHGRGRPRCGRGGGGAARDAPPARYTEPSLVAKLEELEIGRPSTYASIIRTITERDYVFKKGSALVPTWLAFAVTRLLEEHFPRLVDYQFTAEMEDVLDEIAKGFGRPHPDVEGLLLRDRGRGRLPGPADSGRGAGRHRSPGRCRHVPPVHDDGSGIEVRVGRYGTYRRGRRREPRQRRRGPAARRADRGEGAASCWRPRRAPAELGNDPVSGNPLVVKNGRYGPYVTEVLPDEAPTPRRSRSRARRPCSRTCLWTR